uniref:Uncharacterized protein n=1 Tax=Arundo donax TaxID=35708 RepID=A0A0A9HQT9_ARUDO
MLTSMIFQLE